MNAVPAKAKGTTIHIDCANGEAAATALSDGVFSVMASIHTRLEEKHGEDQVAAFYTVFLARFAGFAAAHFGPRYTIASLEATAALLGERAPEMEREMPALQGRRH